MADYTLVNLKQVEDMSATRGQSSDMEARFARKALELKESGLSYFRLAPDFRVPFGHRHDEQEEIYLVTSGSARFKLDDEIVEAGEWDTVRVPAGVTRGMEAGPNGAEIVAFGAPNTENKDAEMVGDFWTD